MDETTNIRTTKLSIAQYLNPHFYEENRGKKKLRKDFCSKKKTHLLFDFWFLFLERDFLFLF